MSRLFPILMIVALCPTVFGFHSSAQAQDLEVSGACPGEVTFTITGWAREESVAVVFSTAPGSLRVPNSYPFCSGTVLGLSSRHIRSLIGFYTDEFGYASYALQLPRGACHGYVQAISLNNCNLSSVVQLP